eukprot:14975988-Ditylum_brightwellii.AAC.1
MGPGSRCLGNDIPDAQWWQMPLPESPTTKPSYIEPRSMIQGMIDEDNTQIAAFSNLAYQCASTFRETNYMGGCNGARIRFSPESEWETNEGTSDALADLEAVRTTYPDVSYADLIVLAGQTAIEAAGGLAMAFCGGRVDAASGEGSDTLAPRVYQPAVVSVKDDIEVKGLSVVEGVALFGRPKTSATLSNQFFIDLKNGTGTFSAEELALLEDDDLSAAVDSFAADEA